MEKVEKYREIIKKIIRDHASYQSSEGAIDNIAIIDEQTDNYILASVGWHSNKLRRHGFPIHVRLKDNKFLIEWDGTEYGVARELLDVGVSKEDIILAFNSEPFRYLTEIAA